MYVRYDTINDEGETRRERNTRFEQPEGPSLNIPDDGLYLWQWFFEFDSGFQRLFQGEPMRASWRDFRAWQEASGLIVRPEEIAILQAMDLAYCEELSKELESNRQLAREKAKREGKQ